MVIVNTFSTLFDIFLLKQRNSSDDTSVAIVEKHNAIPVSDVRKATRAATLHFHEKITADSRQYQGIHPIVALDSHRENLAKLVNKALKALPAHAAPDQDDSINTIMVREDSRCLIRRKPDFVSVTRGPGMRSHLSVGLDTAKGLSVAWQIPMVGVHHMQAHALTPRLVSALEQEVGSPACPAFPFFSLLVSGGHSMLILSRSLTDHETLASTSDIAVGEALDKIARKVLFEAYQNGKVDTMNGRTLETFAFPGGAGDYNYRPPATRGEEIAKEETKWGWDITTPFAETKALDFSFSGIESMVTKILTGSSRDITEEERDDLAKESMRVCFEHLASRTVLALLKIKEASSSNIDSIVVSGGVASNKYLRAVLRSFLDIRGFSHVQLLFPPLSLCTDNAAMIGWAGIEMYEAGWHSDLSCKALRRWSMDSRSGDGGILGTDDWVHNNSD